MFEDLSIDMGSRILLVDCSTSGISGDMLLAALIDLGADEDRIAKVVESIPSYLDGCRWVRVRSERVNVNGISARRIIIDHEDTVKERSISALIEASKRCLESEGIGGWPYRVALGALEILARAEASIHGTDLDDVHLHELGAVDTVVDIVGVSIALHSLGLEGVNVLITSLAVGGGLIATSHGLFSAPAPVTLEMLKDAGIPFHGGPLEGELATPTGVALLISLKGKFIKYYPAMRVERIGYGAGTILRNGKPSILRVLLGESIDESLDRESIVILETNLDDVSGEVLSHATQRLLDAGALDVQIVPAIGKKGRPSSIVKVMVEEGKEAILARAMMEELGTLGVRFYHVNRFVAKREVSEVLLEIDGKRYPLRVKHSYIDGKKELAIKPEFEDIIRISRETGIPARKVLEIAKRSIVL